MTLTVERTELPDILVFSPQVFGDPRGFFMETFHRQKYRDAGVQRDFVQDNYSHSCRGTLRGLHYQLRFPQAKLISVIWGEIFDVVVDIRRGSPTFGKWTALTLSDRNRKQLYVPEGFAHGFCVMSEKADVMYKCTDFYHPEDERGILWSDPDLGIRWPLKEPILSEKDRKYLALSKVRPEDLPEL